ncbi:chromate reductase [Cryobacterium sp. MP_M5]|uniref:NADPH-dependent FMN reductase n=1 Tax=unclassified Cryobacterium TaxID=2649013 RepID=UPI0018C996C2|nr:MULTISPECIES: NADPH-dependent FMN reductase [unclassified Cryobacterium]MBG6057223.1 NAD(P)H-dependent FMN reductase [Cryobacterium sp. MP_M3]MEC5175422.1 chromate reductase [Cryobacterium sp. MP_M5]
MRLLLVSGSTRQSSTNNAALATVRELAPAGSAAIVYQGLSALPAFNPDDDRDPVPATVAELREQIIAADAVVFSTPEYAGTLPGSFKNLLDWTVGSEVVSGKPVAWINAAAPGRGHGAIATLESVLGYVDAQILDRACIDLPITRDMVDSGTIRTQPERDALARWWTTMLDQEQRNSTDA